MIEKEKIKVGLEFKLPFREGEYEEEEARFRHRKIMSEYGYVLPKYKTDLKTIDGVKLFITPYRPIFKVIETPRDCFKINTEKHYLGSFVEVTCEDHTFRLSTEDVIERGEKESFMNSKPSSNAVDNFLNQPINAAGVFRAITNKMCNTFEVKNSDYGDSFHKLFEECGMTYAYGHLAEKLERINSLRKNEAKVKGESMKDSLYDLANYAILTIIELEKNEKK